MNTKLSSKQKEVLREIVKFTCQGCHKHEKQIGILEPHRINPGYKGGEYTPNNILMLCKRCHQLRAEEW